jgi:hypothetical protein
LKSELCKKKKALVADTSEKERVGSDISECSDNKTKQNNIHSKSTPPQETSLVVVKYGMRKKLARLDFSGVKEWCNYLVTIVLFMILKL